MGRNGSTFAHPKLAIKFAAWLDVKFEVWCHAVIEDILTQKADLIVTRPETSATVQVTQAIGSNGMQVMGAMMQNMNLMFAHFQQQETVKTQLQATSLQHARRDTPFSV